MDLSTTTSSPNVHQWTLVILSGIVGVLTLGAVGGNDVANAQATAVGSGALSFKGAVILAAICEFLGASLMGTEVSHALGDDVINNDHVADSKYAWGIPVSSTHSIVGALIGFGLVVTRFDGKEISWDVLSKMAIAWVVTPVMAAVLADVILQLLELYLPTPKRQKVNPNDPQNGLLSVKRRHIKEESQTATKLHEHIFNQNNEERGDSMTQTYNIEHDPIVTIDENDTISTIDENEEAQNHTLEPNPEIIPTKKKPTKRKFSDFQIINIAGARPPLPVKFGLLLAIILTIIFVFLLVGGPPEMKDLYKKLSIYAIIGMISGIFILTWIIGYFLEDIYRNKFIEKHYKPLNDSKILTTKTQYSSMLENPDERDVLSNNDKNSILDTSTLLPYEEGKTNQFVTEDYFVLFIIIASGAVSFAHGGNDIANVIGPFGAIYHYQNKGNFNNDIHIPIYVYMIGGIIVVIGFLIFGKAVLHTIGTKITKLSYRAGFAAQMSSAITVLIATVSGIPVSTTTVIVGAVTGVGYYRTRQLRKQKLLTNYENKQNNLYDNKIENYNSSENDSFLTKGNNKCSKWLKDLKKLNIKTLAKILAYWVITIPINAIIGGVMFEIVDLIRHA